MSVATTILMAVAAGVLIDMVFGKDIRAWARGFKGFLSIWYEYHYDNKWRVITTQEHTFLRKRYFALKINSKAWYERTLIREIINNATVVKQTRYGKYGNKIKTKEIKVPAIQ